MAWAASLLGQTERGIRMTWNGTPQPGQPQHWQPPQHVDAPPAYAPPVYAPHAYAPPPQAEQGWPAQQGWAAPQQGWPAQQAWAPAPAPTKPALLPAALPMHGEVFTTVLAPLSRRTGRWFLAWAIAIGFFAFGQLLTIALLLPGIVGFVLELGVGSAPDPDAMLDLLPRLLGSPEGMLAVNLAWGVMIPGAIVALAAFGRRGAGLASSVVGRWRWGAVGRAALVIVPIFALYIGFSLTQDPTMEWRWDPNWPLVAVILLTTPLQATGEEFAFRGFLSQMIGGWRAHRFVPALVMLVPVLAVMVMQPATWYLSLVALLAAAIGPWVLPTRLGNAIWVGIATGVLFGAVHAHPSIAATLQLSLVGFVCSMLTYRTGGLEAASVLHTANNVFIMVPLALTGTSAFSAQPVAGEDWLSLAVTAVALGLSYLAVHLTMRRAQRTTEGAPGAEWLAQRPPQPQQPAFATPVA